MKPEIASDVVGVASHALFGCPFCGTESGTSLGPIYLKNGDMWEGMMHEVHCINCTVTMSDYSREKVEAKWNLRCLPNA